MPSSGMLRRVAVVGIGASEERSASIIRVRRIGELGKTLAITGNRGTLGRNSISSPLHRATRYKVREDIYNMS
jgi:hypothetical protein